MPYLAGTEAAMPAEWMDPEDASDAVVEASGAALIAAAWRRERDEILTRASDARISAARTWAWICEDYRLHPHGRPL